MGFGFAKEEVKVRQDNPEMLKDVTNDISHQTQQK
jgi:hypothetical protein